MKIESLDQEIRTLLSSGYYRIPRFQRPYSWTRENIQEFWDDVVRDNPEDYFIGSMVVFKESNQRFGVVDGQQRLTTIMILLAMIRNTLAEHGFQDLAEGIQGLIERKNIDNKPEFVLSTRLDLANGRSKRNRYLIASRRFNCFESSNRPHAFCHSFVPTRERNSRGNT